MAPRRRKSDAPPPWWHARSGFIAALVVSPAVFIAAVNGVVSTFERIVKSEQRIVGLESAVVRIETDLRELKAHRH